jgi:hypothetical protein
MKILWGILFLFSALSLLGQQDLSAGLLPKVNVSARLSDQVGLVSSVESRQLLYDDPEVDYRYVLTDAATFFSFRTQPDQKFNLGYTLRFRNKQLFHRFSQQYNFVDYRDSYRVGHRLALDQTFAKNEPAVYRARYRVTLEKPLSGDKVDPREFYLKAGVEFLGAYEERDWGLEGRLVPLLGYEINDNDKVEAGLDYRLDGIFSNAPGQDFWWAITWYTAITRPEQR